MPFFINQIFRSCSFIILFFLLPVELGAKIYDGFTFFNELELLELRLHQHAPFVDAFILVEAKETFRGDPKPLYYEENKQRFQKFHDKIIHIVVDKIPADGHQGASAFWHREAIQRNSIFQGLKSADLTDIVIISDADEILHEKIFRFLLNRDLSRKSGIKSVEQDLFYYHMNYQSKEGWVGPVICRKKDLLVETAHDLRSRRHSFSRIHGGWHFSYLGGGERIQKKVGAYSEIIFDDLLQLDPKAAAQWIYETNKDSCFFREIDEHFPKYLLENRSYYEKIGFIHP